MSFLRRVFIEISIRIFEKVIGVTRETLTKEQSDGLLSMLWQNPAFRNYIADRNQKIIYTMAGGEGMDPEPRDKYLMHAGQRVEILLLGSKAKLAYERIMKGLSAKAQETPDSSQGQTS